MSKIKVRKLRIRRRRSRIRASPARIRLLRRRIRASSHPGGPRWGIRQEVAGSVDVGDGSGDVHVAGSVSSVDGSGLIRNKGYPTLPGSDLFAPARRKEWAFPAKAGSFWPKPAYPGYPGSRDPGHRIPVSRDPVTLYLWSSLIAFREYTEYTGIPGIHREYTGIPGIRPVGPYTG